MIAPINGPSHGQGFDFGGSTVGPVPGLTRSPDEAGVFDGVAACDGLLGVVTGTGELDGSIVRLGLTTGVGVPDGTGPTLGEGEPGAGGPVEFGSESIDNDNLANAGGS